ENCTLHLYYALPPIIFVDSYELGNRADSYSFQYAGTSNLELPVAAFAESTSSSLLLNVASPPRAQVDLEVPLHVRYGAPPNFPSQHTEIQWPDAFLACHSHVPGSRTLPTMPREFSAPFEHASIIRLEQSEASPVELIQTPVGNPADVGRVELGTAVIILASFFYLVRATRRAAARLMDGRRPDK
ncbi:PIG-X, partial [Mycena sp. CBHHK59/15]